MAKKIIKSRKVVSRTKPAGKVVPPPKRAKPLAPVKLVDSRVMTRERPNVVTALHGIVRARAGTGKTFTLIMGVAKMFADKVLADSYTFRGPRNKQLDVASNPTLWGKVEKQLGFKVQPSSQQKAVWDFMAKERPRTVCYVAFNNSIVEEFGEKYEWLVKLLESVGVKLVFRTIHSLGNEACSNAYHLRGFKSVNKYRVSDLLSAFWQVDLREVWKEKAETIEAIQELVSLCKVTMAGPLMEDSDSTGWIGASDDELDVLATHYGILLNGNREEVFKAVRHLLVECRKVEDKGNIDFNDMIWLPVVNNLPMPEQFDLLLVDEAQDLNRCQQELVLKIGKRIILVGDERQAIYGFAGADVDSIDRMQGILEQSGKVGQMVLTQTRRCGKAIVERAQVLVPDFEAHPQNGAGKVSRVPFEELEGEVSLDPAVEYKPEKVGAYSLGEEDMVLCRVNAPLVGLAFRMLKAGKRVNIKGRDIGKGLKAFIKKSKCKGVSEFLDWLDKFQKTETERIQKRRNVDAEALVTLEDKCLCLRTFCEGAFTLKDVNKNIDEVFKGKVCPNCKRSYDDTTKTCYDCKVPGGKEWEKVRLVKPEGTLLSSIHRAKGLESKRVFILRPDLLPHPKAKSPWEKGQEANLEYVAVTRAIEELIFVDGKVKNVEA